MAKTLTQFTPEYVISQRTARALKVHPFELADQVLGAYVFDIARLIDGIKHYRHTGVRVEHLRFLNERRNSVSLLAGYADRVRHGRIFRESEFASKFAK